MKLINLNFTSPKVLKFVPLILSLILFSFGYIFSHLIELGLCHKIMTSGAGGNYCGDSYIYYINLADSLKILGFYAGLSFLVLSLLPTRVVQFWIIPQFLWIIGWIIFVNDKIGSTGALFSLSFVYFVLTSIGFVIYGCQLRRKNKQKIWPILVPFLIFFLLFVVLFVLIMSATFINVG